MAHEPLHEHDGDDAAASEASASAEVEDVAEGPWHKNKYSEVMSLYLSQGNGYVSWLRSTERRKCIQRMPDAELRWRRFSRVETAAAAPV